VEELSRRRTFVSLVLDSSATLAWDSGAVVPNGASMLYMYSIRSREAEQCSPFDCPKT
jgi:hypothetical protein